MYKLIDQILTILHLSDQISLDILTMLIGLMYVILTNVTIFLRTQCP